MDEAFFLRARRMLDDRVVPLDHTTLVAMTVAAQAQTPTAAAQLRLTGEPCPEAPVSLEAMLRCRNGSDPGPGAAQAAKGCFNRAVATRQRNLR